MIACQNGPRKWWHFPRVSGELVKQAEIAAAAASMAREGLRESLQLNRERAQILEDIAHKALSVLGNDD